LYLFTGYGKIAFVKSQLHDWLGDAEFQRIIEAALAHTRTISTLFSFTYDRDPLIRWRAVDAIGRCAAHLCSTHSATLKNLLRRLFWLMSDESGAVAWHAPEAIGEIVRSDPPQFADFIPMTVSLLNLEPEDRPPFLPGTLYALGRIGGVAPDVVKEGLSGIIASLTEADTQARAMAVWCLGQLREREILLQHSALANDHGSAIVYRDEHLVATAIGSLWIEALTMTPPE
jgi:type IV secretory pathway protease TraF